MKVKALQEHYGFGGRWTVGLVGEVPDPIAKSYIAAGLVEAVADVKPASIVSPTPVEEVKPQKIRMKRSKPETVENPEVA